MKTKLLAVTLVVGLLGFTVTANATPLVFNLGGIDVTNGGATLPGNLITMTFDNLDLQTVQLTIDFNNVAPGAAKLNKLYFNVDPSLNFSDLIFTVLPTSTAPTPSISGPSNGNNVGGQLGKFDIVFDYPQSNSNKFSPGETSIVNITLSGGGNLFADAFNDTSTGGFPAAVHLNIAEDGQSGEYAAVPVPEPATLLLFGTGLAGLAGVGLGRKKRT